MTSFVEINLFNISHPDLKLTGYVDFNEIVAVENKLCHVGNGAGTEYQILTLRSGIRIEVTDKFEMKNSVLNGIYFK